MSLLMPKVHLKLNLNVPVMLNVSGVRGMDILLQTVQTRELIKIMVIWNLKVTDLIVKACHHWRIVMGMS
jgi:hypothetical protein